MDGEQTLRQKKMEFDFSVEFQYQINKIENYKISNERRIQKVNNKK